MHKLLYLDGIRGLAALIVVLNHFIVAFYPALYNASIKEIHTRTGIELWLATTPLNLMYNGSFSVCMFFVLSGYVLSYKFFRIGNTQIIVQSAVKRYFRLALPVLASVILAYILLQCSLFYNQQAADLSFSDWWLGSFWGFEANIWNMFKNGLIDAVFFYDSSYNPVLWTMTYELYGSFFVFSFALLFGNLKNRYFFYIAAIYLLSDTFYLAFILGMLLADISRYTHFFEKALFQNRLLKICFLLIGLYLASYPAGLSKEVLENSIYKFFFPFEYSTLVDFYHIIGSFFILLTVLLSHKLRIFFASKPFFFLGKLSFSLYLLHLLVIGSFTSWLFIHLLHYYSYSVSVMISFLLSLPVLLALSLVFYKFVDKSSIQVANKISSTFFNSKSTG